MSTPSEIMLTDTIQRLSVFLNAMILDFSIWHLTVDKDWPLPFEEFDQIGHVRRHDDVRRNYEPTSFWHAMAQVGEFRAGPLDHSRLIAIEERRQPVGLILPRAGQLVEIHHPLKAWESLQFRRQLGRLVPRDVDPISTSRSTVNLAS